MGNKNHGLYDGLEERLELSRVCSWRLEVENDCEWPAYCDPRCASVGLAFGVVDLEEDLARFQIL